MDHIVYLDKKSKELEKILSGEKTMIIRGATGRKMPYARVNKNDILYFLNNNAEGKIKAKAKVENVFNSDKMDKDTSEKLVQNNQDKLNLSQKQFQKWAGKRYIVLVEINEIKEIEEFEIDKSDFSNMDDWLPVENIEKVKID